MLEIKNLSFAFGKKIIFDHVQITFNDNQVTGIVGKNGVGKTTLFRIIANIYTPKGGTITFNGHSIAPSEISFMPTEPYFYPYMKGIEFLNIVASNSAELNDSKKYAHNLELPLEELVDNYSTGMRKKLAFSALFSLNKPVIILDEPYNGVDLEGNEIIKHIIKSNIRNKTVILSSHILSTVTDISDSIFHISELSDIDYYTRKEFEMLERKIHSNMIDKIAEIDSTAESRRAEK